MTFRGRKAHVSSCPRGTVFLALEPTISPETVSPSLIVEARPTGTQMARGPAPGFKHHVLGPVLPGSVTMQGVTPRSLGSPHTKLGGLWLSSIPPLPLRLVLIHSDCSFSFFASDMEAAIKPQEGIRTQAGITFPCVTIRLSLPRPLSPRFRCSSEEFPSYSIPGSSRIGL